MEEYSSSYILNHPMTQDDWNKIMDVDMDNIPVVSFHTKHGKNVEYVKAIRCINCKYGSRIGLEVMCTKHSGPARKFGERTEYSEWHIGDWYCADAEKKEEA